MAKSDRWTSWMRRRTVHRGSPQIAPRLAQELGADDADWGFSQSSGICRSCVFARDALYKRIRILKAKQIVRASESSRGLSGRCPNYPSAAQEHDELFFI